jgi:hypothetical protein
VRLSAAVERLRAAGLLGEDATARASRRSFLKKTVVGAAAVPLVTTLVAPAAAQTASCIPEGEADCFSTECCPGLICHQEFVGGPFICITPPP